jgi:serine protease
MIFKKQYMKRISKRVFGRLCTLPVGLLVLGVGGLHSAAFAGISGGTVRGFTDHRPRPEVRRDIPVIPDVVTVKHRNPGLMKAGSAVWRNALQKAGAKSVRPAYAGHAGDATELSKIFEIELAPGTDVWKAAYAFYDDPSVEWAEPQYTRRLHYTPNDPMFNLQWYLDKIQARDAWNVSRNSKSVIIGMVDTGVDMARADIAASIWKNHGEIPDNGLDDDGNGFVDDVHGWDFGDKDNDPNPSLSTNIDDKWHGTATSMTAAAIGDNGIGMASPSFNATVMPVKVTRDADANQVTSYGYAGIVYAADNGADVINCSWGGMGASFEEQAAIDYVIGKGVLVVASAGNEPADEIPQYPASYNGVLSVTATGETDQKSWWAKYGYAIDLAAPGESFYVAWARDQYQWMQGTSFSAPLVAGTAALVKAIHPGWTGLQAGEQVRVTADPIDGDNPDFAGKLGRGRLNAYRALTSTSPSVRLAGTRFMEGTPSDGNTLFDPGEEVLLSVTLKNFLEPASGIQVQFTSDNPSLSFTNSTLSAGTLATGATWTNDGNPVRIRLAQDAERGTQAAITVHVTADGGYIDADHMLLDISNSFATLKGGNVQMTVSSIGRLGSADTEINQGVGFIFGNAGNLLFEGGFMAAVSADSVSDVVRGVKDVQSRDMATAPGGEILIVQSNDAGDEQGSTVFTDEKADRSLRLGVALTAYAFQNAPDRNFMLLAYRLYNCSDRPIRRLYAGLFMDWDIEGNQDATHNLGGFDPELNLGYIDEPQSQIHGGLRIFGEGYPVNYKLDHNYMEAYFGLDSGYTDRGKWEDLSGGVRNVTPAEQGDYSHVMGVGPVSIDPGDTVLFGYAVLGGTDLAGLKTSAAAAGIKWRQIVESSSVEGPGPSLPLRFNLEANYPNPFNPETSVGYALAEKGHVRLTVCDARGREWARLVDRVQEAGRYRARWDGTGDAGTAPSGVYLCTLRAGSFVRTIKMLLLR